MGGVVSNLHNINAQRVQGATTEAPWIRYSLIAISLVW